MMNEEEFSNKILHRSLKDMGDGSPRKEYDSVKVEYKLNSYGYRCSEFNGQEVLILGCSHTEGHGMPIELTWPYLISKKINKDYINLAKGGDGMQAQVTKAFQFFKEFYNPKYIFAVLPITRMEVPLIGVNTNNVSDNLMGKGMFNNSFVEKFSKYPHVIEKVLTEEFAIFYNSLFIKMLIAYCDSNNIKLIWTNYNDSSLPYDLFKNFSNGYFKDSYSNCESLPTCHSEFSNNEFFYRAADYKKVPPGHWNFHKHIHIAESMYDML
jgi:hypothetical protein